MLQELGPLLLRLAKPFLQVCLALPFYRFL